MAQKAGGVEGQQHRNGLAATLVEAFAGGAIELTIAAVAPPGLSASIGASSRTAAPQSTSSMKRVGLHLLRGHGNDARGEREARYSDPRNMTPTHLAGAVVATSGLDWEYLAGESDSRQDG